MTSGDFTNARADKPTRPRRIVEAALRWHRAGEEFTTRRLAEACGCSATMVTNALSRAGWTREGHAQQSRWSPPCDAAHEKAT